MIKTLSSKSLDLFTVSYVTVPVLIFYLTHLRPIPAIICCILTVPGAISLFTKFSPSPVKDIQKNRIFFWFVCVSTLFLWVCLSGIGGYGYQNTDFRVRNPIYNDLCSRSWPVFYQGVKGNACLSYYYLFWLPPALISKFLSAGDTLRNFILFLYALSGVIISFRLITKAYGERFVNLLLFIFFGGMDIFGIIFLKGSLPLYGNPENILGIMTGQYTSMTTQLYWVFNQSIPLWILMSLFILMDDMICFIGVLCFVYSPWSVFGILPLVIVKTIKKHGGIRKALLSLLTPETVSSICVSFVFILFYMSNGECNISSILTHESSGNGVRFVPLSFVRTFPSPFTGLVIYVCIYILFVFLEFYGYWVVMKSGAGDRDCPCSRNNLKYHIEDGIQKTIIVELLLFPMIYTRDGNFCMRASIPALFLFMCCILSFLNKDGPLSKKGRIKRIILIVMLSIGTMMGVMEIRKSIYSISKGHRLLFNPISSFSEIVVEDKDYDDRINRWVKTYFPENSEDYGPVIQDMREMYLSFGYENSLFCRILGKKTEDASLP